VRNNPSKTSRAVAANMRRELAARGLNQNDLAARCNVTAARISEILRPRGDLKLATVEAVANALGCSVGDLFPTPEPAAEPAAQIS